VSTFAEERHLGIIIVIIINRTNRLCKRSWGYVTKLHFHHHVDCLHSQALIRFITCNSSSLDSLNSFCIALYRSKFEYASVVWNNRTLADSDKLENILGKYRRSCVNRRFGGMYDVGSSLEDFSTMKMEAIGFSKTSIHTRSTLRHILKDGIVSQPPP
jgi:hypothetical protein